VVLEATIAATGLAELAVGNPTCLSVGDRYFTGAAVSLTGACGANLETSSGVQDELIAGR
jgi:hypothetical protein